MIFKVPSNPSDSAIPLPRPCESRGCRENPCHSAHAKAEEGTEERTGGYFSLRSSSQSGDPPTSLQPQDSPRLFPGHNTPTTTTIRYKPTRAAPQSHGGLADPPHSCPPRLSLACFLAEKLLLLLLTSASPVAAAKRCRLGPCPGRLLRSAHGQGQPLPEQEHVGATPPSHLAGTGWAGVRDPDVGSTLWPSLALSSPAALA